MNEQDHIMHAPAIDHAGINEELLKAAESGLEPLLTASDELAHKGVGAIMENSSRELGEELIYDGPLPRFSPYFDGEPPPAWEVEQPPRRTGIFRVQRRVMVHPSAVESAKAKEKEYTCRRMEIDLGDKIARMMNDGREYSVRVFSGKEGYFLTLSALIVLANSQDANIGEYVAERAIDWNGQEIIEARLRPGKVKFNANAHLTADGLEPVRFRRYPVPLFCCYTWERID